MPRFPHPWNGGAQSIHLPLEECCQDKNVKHPYLARGRFSLNENLITKISKLSREMDLGSFQAKAFQHLQQALVISSLSPRAFKHTEKNPWVWGAAPAGGQAGCSSEDTGICGYVPAPDSPGHLGET